jgi:hypothetical protein
VTVQSLHVLAASPSGSCEPGNGCTLVQHSWWCRRCFVTPLHCGKQGGLWGWRHWGSFHRRCSVFWLRTIDRLITKSQSGGAALPVLWSPWRPQTGIVFQEKRKVAGAFPVAIPYAMIHVAHRHCPCPRCRATVSARMHVLHARTHLALSMGANQDRLLLVCKAPHSCACLPTPMQRARRMIPAAGIRKRERPETVAVIVTLQHCMTLTIVVVHR